MNNYEKLKTLCHQNFIGSERCGECNGTGQEEGVEIGNTGAIVNHRCLDCSGKGYIIPLEFGCEVKNRYAPSHAPYIFISKNGNSVKTKHTGYYKDGEYETFRKNKALSSFDWKNYPRFDWQKELVEEDGKVRTFENLGKPLALQDVLRLLKMTGDTRYEGTILIGDELRISRPTNKTETYIEDGVGINNEQYGVVTNDVWLDITIDITKEPKDWSEEILQAIIDIVE